MCIDSDPFNLTLIKVIWIEESRDRKVQKIMESIEDYKRPKRYSLFLNEFDGNSTTVLHPKNTPPLVCILGGSYWEGAALQLHVFLYR